MVRREDRDGAVHTIVAGLVAGASFATFEMITNGLLLGPEGFWMPLRMIGAIVLGSPALRSSYSLASAALVGVAIHAMLSMVFAMIFIAVVQPPSTTRSSSLRLVSSSIFGCVLWVVNFYVIAPVFNVSWFGNMMPPVIPFLAHTFFYGCVLGVVLNRLAVVGELFGQVEGPPRRV